MKYVLLSLSLCLLTCFACSPGSTGSDQQEAPMDSSATIAAPAQNQPPSSPDRVDNQSSPTKPDEGRRAPTRVDSKASFTLVEESKEAYEAALQNRVVYAFKDTDGYQGMKQHKDLCWGVPLARNTLKNYCPTDVDQYKLDYIGRWEDRDALVFEAGITGFHPFTNLVELESGWEIELEGYLHISPGSRWVAGIANEPLIWVGMYIYDAQSLNLDRVYEVGEPDGGYADAFHRFNVSSPVWVSDAELHLWEDLPETGERKYYVLKIEE